MDMVHTIFMRALLNLNKSGEVQYAISSSSLVYDARNNLAKQAINEGYDRMLWLDSDMDFQPDFLDRLHADLDENRIDIVGGLYFSRKTPLKPIVYEKVGYYHSEENDEVTPLAVPFFEYPKEQMFTCEGIGFGGVLMNVSLIKKVQDKFGLPFSPILGFGEDLSFCARARQVGAEIYCDSRAKMGHVGLGVISEETYLSTVPKT